MTLRGIAMAAAVAAAIGSTALLHQAGHPPFVLVVLFTLWVLFPFAALIAADMFSKGWSVRTRTALHATTLAVAVGSFVLYAIAVMRMSAARPTPWFVLIPPVSCVVAAVVMSAAAFTSRGLR